MIRANGHRRSGLAALAMGACAALPAAAEPNAAEGWPTRVAATYKIQFQGFEIGKFDFTSEVNGKSYTLSSNAELSALMGAFKWRGTSRSSGAIASADPRPAGYTFDYKSSSKAGSVKMGFSGNKITSINLQPPSEPHPDAVPLQESHLVGVLDPLTAAMAVSRNTANPCARKIEIFDGKQRFDLVLSFRRQQKIVEKQPTGHPGFAFVCRVRYTPVAGYKLNRATEQMSESTGIELALRPIPTANVLVPYQVTIPTQWGTATLMLNRVEITTRANGQIALAQ